MIIKNGKVLNDDFVFEYTDIEICEEKIKSIDTNLSGENVIDATNLMVLPGFIDSHIHGAVGRDFLNFNENLYKDISEFEGKNGTTTIVATVEAAPCSKMIETIEFYEANKNNVSGAKFAGIHLEGPFFNTDKIGAIDEASVRVADVEEFKKYVEAGDIKIISLAPEIENALELIKYASENGVTVSMGHTNATYEEAKQGVLYGVTRSTHTFNAMSALHHREPGVVGCALTEDNVYCELICDFYHIHPAVCKLVFDTKGADRVIMISDAVMSTGLPDGEYTNALGHKYIIKNKQARLEDGTICGGGTCLIDGIKNLTSIGISIEDAVKAASINPAKSAKIDTQTGSLKEGKYADIVICDTDFNIKYVIVNGKIIFQSK